MNIQERQLIIDRCDNFERNNLKKVIAETYQNESSLSNIQIGDLTADDFHILSINAFKQFRAEFSDNIEYLVHPINFTGTNDLANGNFNIHGEIDHYLSSINGKNFESAVVHLKRIISYQIQSGFWNKSKIKIHKSDEKEILNLTEKLNLIEVHLQEYSKQTIKLIGELQVEKENINNFYSSKQQEYQNLSSLLESSNLLSTNIQNVFTNVQELQSKIDTIYNTQKSKIADSNEIMDEHKRKLAEYSQEVDNLKKSLTAELEISKANNGTFDDHLKTTLNKSATFEDRLVVLNELIGKEGAKQLFQTFRDRKEELTKPVENWKWTVIVVAAVVTFFIIAIFTNFFGMLGTPDVNWQFLIVNSLKSTPAIILLYFTIKQYVKERAYQEEYAFRSAIALTIQAYSDIAGKNKEDLILNAVNNIYKKPTLMKEKDGSLFSVNGGHLKETLKEINDTLKTLRGK